VTQDQTLPFEASAYLQRLIGRELITSEELAIIELVKNAYDAGARHVTITIHPQSSSNPGEIIIRDDGVGMALTGLRRVFMMAGYSERPEEVNQAPRVPTGEKGIGRFAADKLGADLLVQTKTPDAKTALQLVINWDDFVRSKRFNEITAPYSRVLSPELGGYRSGTYLRISRLRTKWDSAKIKTLRESLADLLDPFNPPPDFQIDIQAPSLNLTGLIEPLSIVPADIKIYFKISKEGKVRRTLDAKSTKLREVTKDLRTSGPTEPIAGLEGRLLYFLQRPKRSLMGVTPGIRLYRDGFRVEPFGRSSDWLGVAEKRAKRAGHAHVVPSHLYGFISISRRQQPDLRHTTSRESLLEGEAVQSMITFLREQLGYLEDHIRSEVTEPRWKESRTRQLAELERSRFQTLSIMSMGLAHELRQPLQAIRTEADNIKQRLHQLGVEDEDIAEAQESIDTNIERIDRNIRHVASISTGSVDDIETLNLAKSVKEQCDLLRPRSSASGIELVVRVPQMQEATINPMTITTVLMNLVQNAIEALQEIDKEKKKIIVSLVKTKSRNVLEVADNGPGISADVRENIFQRFTSKKTGGMGIGLHNCRNLVRAHGGTIEFSTTEGKGAKFRVELPDARQIGG
jgi:signal transduction histidine kinase